MVRRLTAMMLALGLVLCTGVLHARISPVRLAERDPDAFVPRPEFAKAAAIGFDAVAADFYWLQAIQVIGGSATNPERYGKHLGRLIDVVTTLDPWVDHPYRFAAIWLTGSLEDVHQANALLRRSFEYHPWEWRNRFYLGYNLFFYLDDHAAAADVLEEAVSLPGSPRYLPRLVARLRSQNAEIETAELFIRQMLQDAADPDTRAEYQAALDEIEVEYKARHLDRARTAYRKLEGRDIGSPEDLVRGAHPILNELPPPWPASLPPSLAQGYAWILEEETGRLVSSYYGRRYELTFDSDREERNRAWGIGDSRPGRDRDGEEQDERS